MPDTQRFRSWMAIPVVSLCVCIDGSGPARAAEPPVDDPAWLAWVEPLIGNEERATFERLDHRYERAEFIERFWRSHDPDPSTPRNELRDEWAERLSIADEQFGGSTTDRGLAFLLNGGPDFILTDLCPDILRPLEIWIYGDPSVDTGETTRTLLFSGPNEDEMQLEDGDATSIKTLLVADAPPGVSATRHLTRSCRRGREILAAIDGALGRAEALTQPSSGDWLDRFAKEVEGSADTVGPPSTDF
jgi:GWxTD domain-containing protein